MQAITQSARALADETRLQILSLLCEGDATVNDLAARLDLAQPRISTHLALLRRAALVSVRTVGRQRTYHVDAERIRELFAALGGSMTAIIALPPRSAQADRVVRRDMPIRQARTCYDHLAGVAGVQLLDALLERGWLAVEDGEHPRYRLTPEGAIALQTRGVNLDDARCARRMFAFGCLDWTERRPHLGGALGAAIIHALKDAGIVQREGTTRTMLLAKPLEEWLNR
jgi:DNA-binding transcriptional ArsR family regulator